MSRVRTLSFPQIPDIRGTLSVIEGSVHVPFEIRRVFYVYDVPRGADRGAHAHRSLEQVIVCLAGSMDVKLDDGFERRQIHLAQPWDGLYVPPMLWASEANMTPGAIYMVLASAHYDESDYIRDYDNFLVASRAHT